MKQHSGKILIIAVFLFGFGTAGISIYYRYIQTREVLAYFGGQAASLLTNGKAKATLYQLETEADEAATKADASEPPEEIEIEGTTYFLAATKDVAKAKGFHNARNALTIDDSYRWQTKPDGALTWAYLLRLEHEENTIDVVFSTECEFLMLESFSFADDSTADPPGLGSPVAATAMSNGLKKLFSQQFKQPPKSVQE